MSEEIEILSTSSIDSIDNCIICFYPLDYEIVELTCGHKYHFECLKQWVKKKDTSLCCICDKKHVEIKTIYNEKYVDETILDNLNKEIMESENTPLCNNRNVNTNNLESIFLCCNIL
jgi:hypothetical protein